MKECIDNILQVYNRLGIKLKKVVFICKNYTGDICIINIYLGGIFLVIEGFYKDKVLSIKMFIEESVM